MRTLALLPLLAGLLASSAGAASPEEARSLMGSDPARAAALLSVLVGERPGDLDLRCDLGRALSWSGRHEEARLQYETVLSSRGAHREALLGMARLMRYTTKPDEADEWLRRGFSAYPGDPEFLEEERLVRRLRRARGAQGTRRTVRLGLSRDEYSFTRPGYGLGLSYQDRDLHGWAVGGGIGFERRFGVEDVDLGVNVARPLRGRSAYWGLALGGAAMHKVLAAFRASLAGGAALGRGFSAEGDLSYRRFDDATVNAVSPNLSWHWGDWTLGGGYTASWTYYDSGRGSGLLSSTRARVGWSGDSAVHPWASYARTKESFEAGSTLQVNDFSADHYTFGSTIRLDPWEIGVSYTREERRGMNASVDRLALSTAFSWGERAKSR